MAPPQRKYTKGILRKLFILDAQGGYAGEYPVDPECVVEYRDFLAAVPEAGLADSEFIFMGEHRATALYGTRVSLVAISRGPLGPEELTWAKAALVAAESQLIPRDDDDEEEMSPGPDKGVMESLSRAITERETQLAEREAALRETEANTKTAIESYKREMEGRLEDLRGQLVAAQAAHDEDKKALAAERDRLRKQLEEIAKSPKEPEKADADLDALRTQLAKDRKHLQQWAHALVEREEVARSREGMLDAEAAKIAKARSELEAVRSEVEAARSAPPPEDLEAARRELDMRVKILEQKALELLQKEERMQEREKQILQALNG